MKASTSLHALIACTPGQLHAVQAVISYGVCGAWAARRWLSARRGAGQDPQRPGWNRTPLAAVSNNKGT